MAVKEEKTVEIDVPRGVQSGFQVCVPKYGEQAQTPNETPGDLIFQVMIEKHPVYERSHADLMCRINISFIESIVGKVMELQHFSGTLSLDLSKFCVIQPEHRYVIEGKGMPRGKKHGNLIVQFVVEYPKRDWSEEQRAALVALFAT